MAPGKIIHYSVDDKMIGALWNEKIIYFKGQNFGPFSKGNRNKTCIKKTLEQNFVPLGEIFRGSESDF